MTLTNFPDGISTSTISATTIDFPAAGTVIAATGSISDVIGTTAEIGTITGTIANVATLTGTITNAGTLTLGTSTPLTAIWVEAITLSPAAVAPNVSAEQTFAVANLGTADIVIGLNKPTVQAGLMVGGVRVSSSGSIGINFGNITGSTITPTASQVYQVAFIKHG